MKYLPEGFLCLTHENKAALSSLSSLAEAMSSNRVLEARAVMCDARHNLIVDLNGITGVIPRIEGAIGIEEGTVRDIAIISKVGKPVCFTVTAFETDENGGTRVLLSRKNAQLRCIEEFISQLCVGDVINAVITHLEPFGAFCDIGCGIASLLPIDSISVSRIAHPKDRFFVNDKIRAVVKNNENSRITLSQKELLGTWEENAMLFRQGETVSGIIRSVEDYGVFVELTPNLAGLAEPKDNVYPSQAASVYIKSIIPEKMKIKLIIIDAFDCLRANEPPRYFNDGAHIEKWCYSPDCATKVIATTF